LRRRKQKLLLQTADGIQLTTFNAYLNDRMDLLPQLSIALDQLVRYAPVHTGRHLAAVNVVSSVNMETNNDLSRAGVENDLALLPQVIKPSEPVHTGVHPQEIWLTVHESVTYCLSMGLPRTAKTIRKWAQRSIESVTDAGEIDVQRQDTENGFRWLIGRNSLDVKIEQEKELALRNSADQGISHTSEQVHTGLNLFELVDTSAYEVEHVPTNDQAEQGVQTQAKTSEPVHTSVQQQSERLVELLQKQLDRAQHQLDVKDKHIDALLERDRETNILIQGLQTSLTGVVNALPSGRRDGRNDDQHYPMLSNS
jgi:hypothetical protein